MIFTAFGIHFMETSTLRGMMSKLLAFVALDQLKLRCVFLCMKSHMLNIESMFNASVSHLWGREEYH